jgi:SPP1 gp7 family putative phage head morphogenesis protein
MLTKTLNLQTEEQKTAHWKRVDRRRVAYWGVVQKKLEPLYKAEGDAITKAIKDKPTGQLISAAKLAINKGRKNWEKTLSAVSTALIEDFGNDTFSEIEGKEFKPTTEAIKKWIAEHIAEDVTTILETDLEDAKRVIVQGIDDGLTVPKIGSKLRDFYSNRSTYKAMRVARTEVTKSASFGSLEAAKQTGAIKTKTWLSSRDDRVRDAHAMMDGETVDIDGTFSNGCSAPGIGGDPEETIMCRCVLMYGTR